MSLFYNMQRRKLISKMIRTRNQGKLESDITIDPDSLNIIGYGNRRMGRPGNNWWTLGLDEFWIALSKNQFKFYNSKHLTPKTIIISNF